VSQAWGLRLRSGAVVLLLWACAAVVPAPALAAFPGRPGLLAVQPLRGPGLVLVNENGQNEHRVCTDPLTCGQPADPRWSPDGQEIAFGQNPVNGWQVHVIYPDGSCLSCPLGYGTALYLIGGSSFPAQHPAFTATPGQLSVTIPDAAVSDPPNALWQMGVDGVGQTEVLRGPVTSESWSHSGRVAAVIRGRVLVGRPGRLRFLARGGSPSWSPNGSRVALVRRGWIWVVRVRHRSGRRLTRGSSPAWSPDGRAIAFVGSHHRLSVISLRGGRTHHVAGVRGVALDWQPLPSSPPPSCQPPPGSTVVLDTPQSVLTSRSGPDSAVGGTDEAWLGCLHNVGRERLVQAVTSGALSETFSTAALAGGFVALAVHWSDRGHYGNSGDNIFVRDLATGRLAYTAQGGDCPQNELCAIDALVLGEQSFSAWIYSARTYPDSRTPSAMQALWVTDSAGTRQVDSGTSLANLALAGNVVTWTSNGQPRSATLS
jgi:hypothetical protein